MYKHNFNHHHHPQNCNKFSLIYSPLHICSIVEILSPKSVHPLVNGVFIYLLNRCIFRCNGYNSVFLLLLLHRRLWPLIYTQYIYSILYSVHWPKSVFWKVWQRAFNLKLFKTKKVFLQRQTYRIIPFLNSWAPLRLNQGR